VQFRNLVIGIKRKLHRYRDDQAKKADSVFRAQRGTALKRTDHACVFCGTRSLHLSEVHHLDDNHHNNSPENLVAVCKLCHPYHHIGQASSGGKENGLQEGHIGAKNTALIRVPDSKAIPARDINYLLHAIAIALCDEKEEKDAKAVFGLLASEFNLRELAHAIFGPEAKDARGELMSRVQPADMAAALAHLTDDEYERRGIVLDGVRVLYHPKKLKEWGIGWRKEQPAFADPGKWNILLERTLQRVLPAVSSASPDQDAVSIADVLDDDADE